MSGDAQMPPIPEGWEWSVNLEGDRARVWLRTDIPIGEEGRTASFTNWVDNANPGSIVAVAERLLANKDTLLAEMGAKQSEADALSRQLGDVKVTWR